MIEIDFPYYFFGSPNSVDIDVMIDHPMAKNLHIDKQIVAELKATYPAIETWDINLVRIANDQIVYAQKGLADCCHNSLYKTAGFHSQNFEIPLKVPVKRNLPLAVADCVVTLLMATKKKPHKEFYEKEVSPALKSPEWAVRTSVLATVDFDIPFNDVVSENSKYLKSLAFDLGQTISLLNGIEIYTKQEVIENHPTLTDLINRVSVRNINEIMQEKIAELLKLLKDLSFSQPGPELLRYRDQAINFRFLS